MMSSGIPKRRDSTTKTSSNVAVMNAVSLAEAKALSEQKDMLFRADRS